ncbi:hypothetical protein Hamer_G012403 [Homarus americanus]|uniref:Uncharacterized protein n=1 Tax=Homarus americanus TaxID=6706 RepID=A0A8J5KEU1_HOMAM|nr:hypothetical protein Hamer_G012403 [Homarus americanus]
MCCGSPAVRLVLWESCCGLMEYCLEQCAMGVVLGQFVRMRNAGLCVSEIARQKGVSRSIMRRGLQRFEESSNLTDLPRSGRPRRLD